MSAEARDRKAAQDRIRAAKESAARLANGPAKNPGKADQHSTRADRLVAKLLNGTTR
jgi:hypothetical protein